MNIEGTYTLQASPERVWQHLMDQQMLKRIIPGIEELEQIKKDTYQIVVQLKNAPIKGIYRGQVQIVDQYYPFHYRLLLEGEGEQNPLKGSCIVHLNGQDQTTVIAYKGTFNVKKRNVLLTPTLFKGAAKLLIQQFFTELAAQLQVGSDAEDQAELYETTNHKILGTNILVLPTTVATEGENAVLTIARLFKRESINEEQAMRWKKRGQRVGIISGLLFLVWLGTRLPRRK